MHLTCTAETAAMEVEREFSERAHPVASLSDAHAQWHAVHGTDAPCPLDCGIEPDDITDTGPGISCGHCKGRHASVAGVRECATFHVGENDRRC